MQCLADTLGVGDAGLSGITGGPDFCHLNLGRHNLCQPTAGMNSLTTGSL